MVFDDVCESFPIIHRYGESYGVEDFLRDSVDDGIEWAVGLKVDRYWGRRYICVVTSNSRYLS